MVKKCAAYTTEDGKLFDNQDAAYRHEITGALKAKFPGMASTVNDIMANAEWIANLLLPLATIEARPPLTEAEPPLEPETTRSTLYDDTAGCV